MTAVEGEEEEAVATEAAAAGVEKKLRTFPQNISQIYICYHSHIQMIFITIPIKGKLFPTVSQLRDHFTHSNNSCRAPLKY